jgi:hypothetical protein
MRVEPLEDRRMLSFSAPAIYPGDTGALTTADMNNDGIPDLVARTAPNTVGVRLGNGDGTFQAIQNTSTAADLVSLAVGDFTSPLRWATVRRQA